MLFSLIIHYNYASVLNAIRLSHRKRHKSEFPPTKSSAFPQLQRAGSTRRGAGGQPEPAQYRSRPAGLLSPRPPSAARQPNATSRGRSVPAERGDGTGREAAGHPADTAHGGISPGHANLERRVPSRCAELERTGSELSKSGGYTRGHPELWSHRDPPAPPRAPGVGRPKLRSRQVSNPRPPSPAAPRPTCHRSRSRRSGC